MILAIKILGALVFLAATYFAVLGIVIQRRAVRRTEGNLNFIPGRDDPATFTATGNSPYRTAARDYNVWWNSQPRERLEIKSADGLALVGNLLRGNEHARRIALVIHGHRCVSGEMGFISKFYHERGYHVFAPDQRAHGASEGKWIGMGYFEGVDMLRWLALLNGRLPGCEIVMHGISMGAATAMVAAGNATLPENVVCAVEDCGYTDAYASIYHHVRDEMPHLPLKHAAVSTASALNLLFGKYAFQKADCRAALAHAKIPMLFIHGTHDRVVPFEMLRELYDAHSGKKDMLVVPGAPHGICYFENQQAYEEKLLAFLEEHFTLDGLRYLGCR